MSTLTKQSLLDALSSKQKYKNVFPFITSSLQNNPQTLKIIDSTLLTTLVHNKSTPFAKLSSLRLFKDLLLTGNMDLIDSLNEEIEAQVVAAAQYNAGSNEMEKGAKYFAEVEKYKESDMERMSASYVLMALEIIGLMAKWYPLDEDSQPSRFAEYYQELAHVKFPTLHDPQFFRKEDQLKFKNNHQKWAAQIKKNNLQQQSNSKKIMQENSKKQQNNSKKSSQDNKKLIEQNQKEIKKQNSELKSIMQSMKNKITQLQEKLKAALLHTAQCQKQLNQKRKTQNSTSQENRIRHQTQMKQKNLLLNEKQKILQTYENQAIDKNNIIDSLKKQLHLSKQKCNLLTTKLKQTQLNSLSPIPSHTNKSNKTQQIPSFPQDERPNQNHKQQAPSLKQCKRQQDTSMHPPDWSMSNFLAKRTLVQEVNVANVVTLNEAKRRQPLPRTEQSVGKQTFKKTTTEWRGVRKVESNNRTAINWHKRMNDVV